MQKYKIIQISRYLYEVHIYIDGQWAYSTPPMPKADAKKYCGGE